MASRPSQSTRSDSSGPVSPSSITRVRPASPNAAPERKARTASRASANDSVTTTPLPAASPSVFTTYSPGATRETRGRHRRRRRRTPRDGRWGQPRRCSTCFIHAFEPSSRAAAAVGPNASRPRAVTASTAPATRGTSGPTTTRPASISSASAAIAAGSDTSTGTQRPSSASPGLPGAATISSTSAERARPHARECSLPPAPMRRTRTVYAARGRTTVWSRAGPTETKLTCAPAISSMNRT